MIRSAAVDWGTHVKAYRRSGVTLVAYCKANSLKLSTMRHHIYKVTSNSKERKASSFFEVPLARELVISRTADGRLAISGFDMADLGKVVAVWSHAVQS